ncbi:MAG: cupin-like domain-containing protein [Chitinophagaceae bacterium]|nr:cupin-like domain-containing protein [Chitinophagaceae bacterium]MBL0130904.1 cupin-like domain-containing protein [Chitinophagaceae bacterium]MBL0272796.1 cupin-like domain-containing protein [Chitinophagaceae bacterium]
MQLKPVATFDTIEPEVFKRDFYRPGVPVVIRNLSHNWPALGKWNWDYFKKLVGDKKVPLYNNVKSDAYTPINTADDYKTFGEYIDMIRSGPSAWRIFLFNIFDHAPQLIKDFTWPEQLMKGFIKKYPMLFTGGAGSITHMHYDIDLSHILHTQFGGRKRVLMFPYKEQHKLYRKPFEVLSLADFSYYYEQNGGPDYDKFPALKLAEGFDFILEPGDTLFMPAGYWHHMEYLEPGFAMSLRAMQPSIAGKVKGMWSLLGMRNIDTLMKKTVPVWWYKRKEKKVYRNAAKALAST